MITLTNPTNVLYLTGTCERLEFNTIDGLNAAIKEQAQIGNGFSAWQEFNHGGEILKVNATIYLD